MTLFKLTALVTARLFILGNTILPAYSRGAAITVGKTQRGLVHTSGEVRLRQRPPTLLEKQCGVLAWRNSMGTSLLLYLAGAQLYATLAEVLIPLPACHLSFILLPPSTFSF